MLVCFYKFLYLIIIFWEQVAEVVPLKIALLNLCSKILETSFGRMKLKNQILDNVDSLISLFQNSLFYEVFRYTKVNDEPHLNTQSMTDLHLVYFYFLKVPLGTKFFIKTRSMDTQTNIHRDFS